MYNGEIQISENRLSEFLKTADTLQIQGLADGAATAIPAGKESKGSRRFGGNSADEEDDGRYDNENILSNGERGLEPGSDDDIEEISRHERGDGKNEGMTNLLRSQRLRRRQHQGRTENIDYDDIAVEDEDDERTNFDRGSKRRDQCQKASSVSIFHHSNSNTFSSISSSIKYHFNSFLKTKNITQDF